MKILSFISEAIIPLLIFYIVATGVVKKQNVYEDFLKGATRGLKVVVEIMPTLIGLMVAVGILRASGFLELVSDLLGKVLSFTSFPKPVIPLAIVKMFSSSAATGLLLDIFREYGTDSKAGLISSIMLSSTETIFYTMSIYFMTVKVKKTRWTLPGALFATLVGIVASTWLANQL